MKKFVILGLVFCLQAEVHSENRLSYDEAVSKTLSLSPQLRIAASNIDEKSGSQTQSALLPNPEATYSVENIAGNKNWHGWRAAESRYAINQLIELGGKRGYRQQIAAFQYYAAQAGYDATQLSVLNRILKLFISIAASQEAVGISMEQSKVAEEVYKTVAAKVEAGKVALLQQNKAQIALASAQISLEKAKADFHNNKEKLATMWGESSSDFEGVIFQFYEMSLPDAMEKWIIQLQTNPELIQSQMEHQASIQNLNLEKATVIPDVTVSVGYKTIRDTGNKGMILGLSLPIPIFNQNQGNIQKAEAQAAKTMDQSVKLELALENRLSIIHKDLMRAYSEAERIRSTVLKAAEESFELAKEGYREGKFEYLDMLDSQKTLFEIKEKYIVALSDYHQRLADIEYLHTQNETL